MPEGTKVQHDTDEGSEYIRDAVQQASTAMGKFENEKDISRHIKAFFDGKYGPNWHCIVGKGFATHATYEAKTSMFFYLPPLAILLYKMGRPPKLGLVVEFDVLVNYLVLPSCNMCK
ncbi:Dynll1 [Symbiodinium pilosum]|uniref:Dynein light chain n=1 Tax=Symbiodinium pilosum TaxID=2952 RepID=A0A812J2X8_SYMPI|nr:Dynll1 [Symbiodinium pilosum]